MTEVSEPAASASAAPSEVGLRRFFTRLGPGLVVACVCIGPGSILTSSKVGATSGYSKLWVVAGSVVFMMAYTMLAMKLGVVTQQSACSLLAKVGGRPLSLLIGSLVCFIAAAYQFGNNLGVHSALNDFFPNPYWIVLFNGLALAFLFGFRNLYRVLETLMTLFVGLMLIAFAINLSFARPDPLAIAAGFNPFSEGKGLKLELELMGLVGTTLVISNAFYQSYLVRFRGWTERDLKAGMFDSCVGSVVIALLTMMIMCTSAAVFYLAETPIELNTVADVGRQLEPFFGTTGRVVFSIGLFSAAFSSFVVNSMVGGFVLSDALNLGSDPKQLAPRLVTAGVLLSGMVVGLYIILTDAGPPVGLIVAAQVATVVAAPLIAAALLWLTNMRSIMGRHTNGPLINTVAALGLLMLLLMSANILLNRVLPEVRGWFE